MPNGQSASGFTAPSTQSLVAFVLWPRMAPLVLPLAPAERIVWVVASAAAIQAILQAFDAALSGSPWHVLLWLLGSVLIGALAGLSERLKLTGGA